MRPLSVTRSVPSRSIMLVLVAGAMSALPMRPTADAAQPATGVGQAQPAATKAVRNVAQHNLDRAKLAAQGYDVLAYHPEFGGKPTKGKKEFAVTHEGATYHFASKAHADTFAADPARFEPAYGGWCAYAMADGEKVEVDPKSYLISDGRLMLFYNGFLADTRAKWLKQPQALEPKADAAWKKVSGEEARRVSSLPAASATEASTLASRLAEMKARFEAGAPADVREDFERGIREVAAGEAFAKAMRVGDAAPDFALPDARGGTVSLASLREKGPVVLVWYRGEWCPYCNEELQAMQAALPELQAAGATLVAISPQTPERSLSTGEKNNLAFPVLSDAGNAVARQYGLAYELPEVVRRRFEGRLDLAAFNGDSSNTLPVSATYVVGRDGRIAFAHVDADYRVRAEPTEVVRAVRELTN